MVAWVVANELPCLQNMVYPTERYQRIAWQCFHELHWLSSDMAPHERCQQIECRKEEGIPGFEQLHLRSLGDRTGTTHFIDEGIGYFSASRQLCAGARFYHRTAQPTPLSTMF
jgi:hypothetical protein